MQEYLNKNPLNNYKSFKKYATEKIVGLNLNILPNENFFKNIYYPWKKANLSFKWYSIFQNNKTKINKIFLREFLYTYIFTHSINKPFLHKHVIWCSPFFIKKMQMAQHIYLDGTFVHPNNFIQMLVILIYDEATQSRYPAAYILLNSKFLQAYLISLNSLKTIITKYGSVKLNLKSITVDFEEGLITAIDIIFPHVKIIGCFFHYMHNLEKYARKLGLYKNKNQKIIAFIKSLSKIPYIYYKNKNIIDEIFIEIYQDIKKEFNELKYPDDDIYNENNKGIANNNKIYDNEFINKLKEFENYYKSQWIKYLDNNILNYNKLEKYKRSNSYIETYNRHIKNSLRPFIYCKKNNNIDWIYFIGFLIEEENEYKKKIIENMNKEGNNLLVNNESEEEYQSENEDENSSKINKNNNNFKIMINKSNKLTQNIGNTLINTNTLLNNNFKNDKLNEYNYSTRLNWYENSCRYDSFFLYIVMQYCQY